MLCDVVAEAFLTLSKVRLRKPAMLRLCLPNYHLSLTRTSARRDVAICMTHSTHLHTLRRKALTFQFTRLLGKKDAGSATFGRPRGF